MRPKNKEALTYLILAWVCFWLVPLIDVSEMGPLSLALGWSLAHWWVLTFRVE